MNGALDSPIAVQVESDGLVWTFGPVQGMPAAMGFVSEHVWDVDRYRHRYLCLLGPDEAGLILNRHCPGRHDDGLFDLPPRERREPLEAALRDAIAKEHGEPGAGAHGDGLYAHLDVHRPWRLELTAPDCWESDCDHERDRDGHCSAPAKPALWCRGCTPVYVAGGEWDGDPLPECEVDWPCSPVLTMCASFGVPLLGKNLGGIR